MRHKLDSLILKKQKELGRSITLTEIAEATGMTRQALSNFRRSRYIRQVKGETVENLCRYFDCTVGDLMYLEEKESA